MPADMIIDGIKAGFGILVIVGWQCARMRIETESAQRAPEAKKFAIKLFRVRMLAENQMTQGRQMRMQCVEKPELRDLSRRNARLKLSFSSPSPTQHRGALIFQNLQQSLSQPDQSSAGAQLQTRGNEICVVDEVSGAVSQNPCDRELEEILALFGCQHKADVLSSQRDRFFILAGVIVCKIVRRSQVTRRNSPVRCKSAIRSTRYLSWHAKADGQIFGHWRK